MKYPDSAIFYKVSSQGYSANKSIQDSETIKVIFVQNTGYIRGANQENIDSDATCFPDPTNEFVQSNFNRLEGMYVLVTPFGAPNSSSWYKITRVSVYKRHLLANNIDNIELLLKKSVPLPGVS